jgi:hypothetical protein
VDILGEESGINSLEQGCDLRIIDETAGYLNLQGHEQMLLAMKIIELW